LFFSASKIIAEYASTILSFVLYFPFLSKNFFLNLFVDLDGQYKDMLKKEIEKIEPDYIIAFGCKATKFLVECSTKKCSTINSKFRISSQKVQTHDISINTMTKLIPLLHPSMSRLLLSDGSLRITELFARNFNCSLVFLNGCQTAKGKILPGDEIDSFSRAFHFAGAEEVVVNLWEISDSHSPEIAKMFYENIRNGMSTEKALQKTQKKAIASGISPFIWATFKVIK